jgi:threonine synthase
MKSYLTHLECSACGRTFDPHEIQTICPDCEQPLLARYDLKALKRSLTPERLRERPATMWRYRELLPVFSEEHIVSLGETMTPLLPLARLGEVLGLKDLWLKDETRLPTGTFKARGLAMAVSKCVELGIRKVAIPSAGNAAEALSAYAARAGLACFVFMPEDAPVANRRVCQAAGARVFLVKGLIGDAGRIVQQGVKTQGWFDVSTFKEPYRLEGKKTMGLELAEQLGWELPDAIVYPTGGGTGLVGFWKAFEELGTLGWLRDPVKRPKMIAVQPEGCAPIVKAFHKGKDQAEPWEDAQTVAGGLRVPKPFADRLILRVLRESGGTAVAVSDHEIVESMGLLARAEGLFASPEAAATVAALPKLLREGFLRREERVVLLNSGTLLKHVELLGGLRPPVLDPDSGSPLPSLLGGAQLGAEEERSKDPRPDEEGETGSDGLPSSL